MLLNQLAEGEFLRDSGFVQPIGQAGLAYSGRSPL